MSKLSSPKPRALLGAILLVIGVLMLSKNLLPVTSPVQGVTDGTHDKSSGIRQKRLQWHPEDGTKDLYHDYKNQRDLLSKMLNELKKAYGQQSCKMKELQKKLGEKVDPRISENGGWCAETSDPKRSNQHVLDKGFAKALSALLKGKHVGSFGDGSGEYKKIIDELREVVSYTAYDGAPFCEMTTQGRVKFLDLSAPQYGIKSFDWAISVEVGEHIPRKFEDIFLDNLVRHAREGIVLSWAVPGQHGLSHVNNRPLSHVIAQMAKRGFEIHKEEGRPLREAASHAWLSQNIHVYKRTNFSMFRPELA